MEAHVSTLREIVPTVLGAQIRQLFLIYSQRKGPLAEETSQKGLIFTLGLIASIHGKQRPQTYNFKLISELSNARPWVTEWHQYLQFMTKFYEELLSDY